MKLVSWLGLGLVLGAFVVLFSPPRVFSASPEFVPGELLVRYKANVARTLKARANASELATGNATLDALNQHLDVQNIAPLFHSEGNQALPHSLAHIFKINIADTQDVRAAAAMYAQDPNVEYAEPNYIARAILTPNDSEFAQQWGLTKISAPNAWDTTTGNSSVAIAIIDSGIDKTHADLASKLWVNPGEVAGNSVDDDANGYIDDVNGWNFVSSNNNPTDDNGHGTLVAGVVGADTNNGVGVAGVCWQCKLMPVKVMSAGGSANYSDIAAGVVYAAQKGARVINLSLGGSADSQTLHAAIQSAANDYNAVVVAGAGNDNSSANFYPAAYSEVLAVAGTDESDVRVTTSNYGAWVDVSAPGQNIRTTASGGGYATSSGTSLASPFAAGLAGLIRSQNPNWSQALVRSQIINTTTNIDGVNPSYVGQLGSGRINVANGVNTVATPRLSVTSFSVNGTADGHPDPNTTAALKITLGNAWLDATNIVGTLSTTDANVTVNNATQNFGNIAADASGENASAFGLVVNNSAGYNHVIPLKLHTTANGGYVVDLNFNVTTRSSEEPVGPITITTNTVWTNDKTYIINGTIAVANGATLTIQAGTTVKFNGNYKLRIQGKLLADGTSAQPIVFSSNAGEGWDQIQFDDGAEDASTDINGSYISGNILRNVQIEDANFGITCNSATPFLYNVTSTSGLNCSSGGTRLWFTDSNLAGDVTINGFVTLLRNSIGGTVNLVGTSVVQRNTFANGDLTVGSGSTLDGNMLSNGSITVNGSAQVMNNTLASGGITVGDGSNVENNSIENANVGIASSGVVRIVGNRVVGNVIGIRASEGTVTHNLIANGKPYLHQPTSWATPTRTLTPTPLPTGTLTPPASYTPSPTPTLPASSNRTALQLNGSAGVSENTFVGNQVTTIYILQGAPKIQNNTLELNGGPYELYNDTAQNIDAQGNFWGTTNASTIGAGIYDFYDGNPSLGIVNYSFALLDPVSDAPPYVRNITLTPGSPIGIQSVTFDVQFSNFMDQSIQPVVTFGAQAPYTTFAVSNNAHWLDNTHWQGSYDITSLVDKGTYNISVADARSASGIKIAPSTNFDFVVNYAGGITDQTPPTKPVITDDGVASTALTQLHAKWSSSDPDSPIVQYQYAIGTTPGATDVVSWKTPNPATATEVTKTGLNLTTGQKYYFSVRARNEGGLWSEVGVSDGIVADPNFVPLGKPKPKSPLNKAILTKPKVKLDWNDVSGATSYHVVIKQDKKNGKTVFETDVTSSQVTKKLKKGKTYFWKVQACNVYGCFAPSKAWSFSVP